jgi:hypothetical protein
MRFALADVNDLRSPPRAGGFCFTNRHHQTAKSERDYTNAKLDTEATKSSHEASHTEPFWQHTAPNRLRGNALRVI